MVEDCTTKVTLEEIQVSIFYMGINIGAFLAPLACGYLGMVKTGVALWFGLRVLGC